MPLYEEEEEVCETVSYGAALVLGLVFSCQRLAPSIPIVISLSD